MSDSSRWRGWVVAAAIFVLGVGVGGAGMAWAGIRVFRHALQNPNAGRGLADRAAERIGSELTKNLKLTPEESAQVRTILAETTGKLKAVRVQAAAQAGAEFRAAAQRIAAALPREKRAEFYRLVARRYERMGLTVPAPDEKSP